MSKIVLVYPRFPIQEGPKFNVPLSLLHLGTYLGDRGIEVKLIDCNVEDNYVDLLREELTGALCIGISAMTAQLPSALEVCELVKRKFKLDIPIIFGGVHATLFPQQTVSHSLVDYAVVGEGEIPLCGLFRAIERGEVPNRVGGIAFLGERGKVKINPKNQDFDFQKLPPINYKLLNEEVIGQFKITYVGMQTSRGCPYRCAFCINTVVRENRRWRAWEPERVIEEIESLAKLGCKRVFFWDENFFVSKKRVVEILQKIEGKNLRFEWFANVRADFFREDYLNLDFLGRLHKAGLRRFGIGAESGSQKILDYLCKDILVEQLYTSAKLCGKSGIRPTYSFMIGLPKETKEDIKKTVETIGKISKLCYNSRILGPQLFRPYPGSQLYLECVEAGLRAPQTLQEWSKVVLTEFMESNPFKMPWIENPGFVNTVWFYSLLLSVNYKKLIHLYLEYCQVYKKSIFMRVIGVIGIVLLTFVGRLRHRLNFHKFPIEIKILKKYRSAISC